MADIELVIKIPEEIRLALINNIQLSMDQQFICDSYITHAIINGTPLPKGHGRLVDIDLLRDQVSHDEREAFSKHQVWLLLSAHNKKISTIIEADKEQEDDNT